MKFDILTLFPEIFPNVLETSILGRAVKNGLLSFRYTNIRDFSNDKHNKVDDYPYGGGCGMVMQPQPIYDAYKSVVKECDEKTLTVVMSPRGRTFNQEIAKEMANYEHIVLVCGHYEGIDQRVIDEIADYELSVGDFVLTGGELGAMIVCDAVSRLVPGVLAEEESYTGESHFNLLLEYPQYTRPPIWHEKCVPDVLFSGNQQQIDLWRTEQSYIKTETARPDLFEKTGNPHMCIRNSCDKCRFSLVSFANSDEKRNDVYKARRKIARKLQNAGFEFYETATVFTDYEKLHCFIENSSCPVVVVSDSTEINFGDSFNVPTLILTDKEDSSSLYPYYALSETSAVNETVLRFLSIIKTVEKYRKNI